MGRRKSKRHAGIANASANVPCLASGGYRSEFFIILILVEVFADALIERLICLWISGIMAHQSGLQRSVLALYRGCLRAIRTKPPVRTSVLPFSL